MNIITTEKPIGTDLVIARPITPAIFANPESVSEVLAELERKVEAAKATRDISTIEGRAAIASLAYTIARTKTGLDEMGKEVTADWKAKANMVDAERRRIRERCDELKDDFRKPLTDWEEAEKARVATHEAELAKLQMYAVFGTASPAAADVRQRAQDLEAAYNGRDWQEFASRASLARDGTLMRLHRLLEEREKAEREAAERAAQDAERLERERQAREQNIAAQAREEAERLQREAEARAEQERAARAASDERAEALRKAGHEAAIAQMRRAETVDPQRPSAQLLVAQEQLAEIYNGRDWEEFKDAAAAAFTDARSSLSTKIAHARSREEQAELETAERRANEAAAAATRQLEQQRMADAAEEERRANNRRIQARVNKAIVAAIVEHSKTQKGCVELTEEQAKTMVVLLAMKKIPHVAITY